MSSLLSALPLLALQAPAAAQTTDDDGTAGAQDASSPADDAGWVLVDGVALQAGDEVVTLRALDESLRDALRELTGQAPIEDQEDVDRLTWELVQKLVIEKLEAQWGEDLGLDPTQVERLIEIQIEEDRRQLGSGRWIDRLSEEGRDAFAVRRDQTEELHRHLWRGAKLGWPGPAGSRPSRDRWLRPGELRALWQVNREELDPDQVRLQLLVLPVAAAGGLTDALELADELRRRAEAGEDFGALVLEYGAESRETEGILEWMLVPRIAHPGLRAFAETARAGDLSPVLALEPAPGEAPEALLLARMHERQDGRAPEFEDPDLQRLLRQRAADLRDQRILLRERARKSRGAFTWLHPVLRPLQEARGAPSEASPAAPAP